MRSRDGRPLRGCDIPAHPCEWFDEWKAIATPWSHEWNSDWGRVVRAELKRLGWRPVRVARWRVEWR